MILFSQFNGSPELYFSLGYSYLGVIAMILVANLGLALCKSTSKAWRLRNLRKLRYDYLKGKARMEAFNAKTDREIARL